MKIRARFTTPVRFWEKVSTYEPGQGPSTEWVLYTEGEMSVFPCEWRGKFGYGKMGNAIFEADAEGVLDRATIRMPFIPGLYDKLRTSAVIVVKGPDNGDVFKCGEPNPENPNTYEVYGGVDNIYEENQYMEFHAHRYEVTG